MTSKGFKTCLDSMTNNLRNDDLRIFSCFLNTDRTYILYLVLKSLSLTIQDHQCFNFIFLFYRLTILKHLQTYLLGI